MLANQCTGAPCSGCMCGSELCGFQIPGADDTGEDSADNLNAEANSSGSGVGTCADQQETEQDQGAQGSQAGPKQQDGRETTDESATAEVLAPRNEAHFVARAGGVLRLSGVHIHAQQSALELETRVVASAGMAAALLRRLPNISWPCNECGCGYCDSMWGTWPQRVAAVGRMIAQMARGPLLWQSAVRSPALVVGGGEHMGRLAPHVELDRVW